MFCFTTKWANKQINFKATESGKEIGKESWPMAVIFVESNTMWTLWLLTSTNTLYEIYNNNYTLFSFEKRSSFFLFYLKMSIHWSK